MSYRDAVQEGDALRHRILQLEAEVERLRAVEAAARRVAATWPRWCVGPELELRDLLEPQR